MTLDRFGDRSGDRFGGGSTPTRVMIC